MKNINNIPKNIAYYLSGFTDGEGSFMVIVRKRPDYSLNYKVSLAFNVSQKETYILSQFKKHLGCGTIRTRSDGVSYYEVNNFNSITDVIVPFFKKYNFLSANKKFQFSKFCQIVNLMQDKKHLEEKGLEEIINLRKTMNRGGKSSRKNLK